MNPRSRTLAAAILSAGLGAVALTGCSPDEEASTASPSSATHAHEHAGPSSEKAESSAVAGAHNEADVEFNQMMIPHHRQAVVMADLVPTRTTNAELKTLAAQIAAAQQPEIDDMSARLTGWGVEVPAEGDMDMGHGGHGGMPGMMTDEQMTAMENASGAEFDKLWLEGMIAHHEGAVAMANEEIASGSDPASKALAEQIKTSQTAEINQMKQMLGS